MSEGPGAVQGRELPSAESLWGPGLFLFQLQRLSRWDLSVICRNMGRALSFPRSMTRASSSLCLHIKGQGDPS